MIYNMQNNQDRKLYNNFNEKEAAEKNNSNNLMLEVHRNALVIDNLGKRVDEKTRKDQE